MIRKLLALVPTELSHLPRRLGVVIVAQSVCQAAAYLLLVPALRALLDRDLAKAGWWTLAIAVAVAAVALFTYMQTMLGLRIGIGMQYGLQTRLGDRLNALPLGWYATNETGQLSRVTAENVREVQQAVAYLLAKIASAILVPIGVAIGMLFIDWRVAVTMLVAAPVLFLVDHLMSRSYREADNDFHSAAVEVDSRVLEFANAQPVLRAFGAVGEGNRALSSALAGQRGAILGIMVRAVPGLFVYSLFVQAVFVVLAYVAVTQVSGGSLSAASAVALIAVSARFIEPLNQAALIGNGLRAAENAVNRITGLLNTPALPEPGADAVAAQDAEIVLDDVGFGYRADAPVLRGVSFTVPAGTTTAIVGPSGSGKTTLLRLIARFWDVDSGQVRVGGHDVRAQRSRELLDNVALVSQDVYLFNRSVADNIRVGCPGATDAQVRAAGAAASVDEIAGRLPGGYDARVGEGGAALSGGERQRVSIARALLKDAPIVLLDEATSALDPHSEAVVVRGIHELTRDKTVVVVAHRIATIAHADQILFLEGGTIVERGTHDELLAAGGRYADFWAERTRATGWHLV